MNRWFSVNSKQKISPINSTTQLTNELIETLNDKTFYILTQNIRNLHVLSSNELNYINSLKRNELLYIICLYNSNMTSINEFILSDENPE